MAGDEREQQVDVRDDPERSRFVASIESRQAGIAAYRRTDEQIVFTHTEVDPEFEGHGVGSALARAALDDARSRGLRVVPRCPFFASYIERHPDYADLV